MNFPVTDTKHTMTELRAAYEAARYAVLCGRPLTAAEAAEILNIAETACDRLRRIRRQAESNRQQKEHTSCTSHCL